MEPTPKPEAKITLDELTKTVEFRVLSRRHAQWTLLYIRSFLETGIFDQRAATEAVYGHAKADPENLRTYGYFLRQHPKIQAAVRKLINVGKSPLALQLEEIQRHLDACKPGSTAGQQLLATKHSLLRRMAPEPDEETSAPEPITQPAPAAPHRFKVGETCIVNGKPYRITKVDDEGKALAGEPTNV